MNPTPSQLATKEALELTFATLRSRFLSFRALWLSVGAVLLASLIGSVVCLSWLPLFGTLLAVPLCGAFFLHDMILLRRWQKAILQKWIDGILDLDAFSASLISIPLFPFSPRMVRSMAASLPLRTKTVSGMTTPVRRALSLTLQTMSRCLEDKTALVTLGYSLALASLAWAAVAWSGAPLIGTLAVLPAFALVALLRLVRLRHWRRQILGMLVESDLPAFLEVAHKLSWEAISDRHKASTLRRLAEHKPQG